MKDVQEIQSRQELVRDFHQPLQPSKFHPGDLLAKPQGDGAAGGHHRTGCDTTSRDVTQGMPFTYGLPAQVGAPETPEHLQQTQTNSPKSPLGDGAVLISQPQVMPGGDHLKHRD